MHRNDAIEFSKVPALRSIYDRFAHVMNADKREKLIKAAMRKSKLEFEASIPKETQAAYRNKYGLSSLDELFEFKNN